MRERDSQRSKFFKAISGVLSPYNMPLLEIADIKRFLKSVRNKAPIKRRYEEVMKYEVTIRDGRGYSRSSTSPEQNWMTFPKCDRNTNKVLRAYAFIITYRLNKKAAWYGWRYCSVLLDLVRFMYGAKAEDDLRIAFDYNKVRYTPPLKRVLTPDQTKIMKERGEKLAALAKDRRFRSKFAIEYPEAPVISKDEFGGDWEELFRLWKP